MCLNKALRLEIKKEGYFSKNQTKFLFFIWNATEYLCNYFPSITLDHHHLSILQSDIYATTRTLKLTLKDPGYNYSREGKLKYQCIHQQKKNKIAHNIYNFTVYLAWKDIYICYYYLFTNEVSVSLAWE